MQINLSDGLSKIQLRIYLFNIEMRTIALKKAFHSNPLSMLYWKDSTIENFRNDLFELRSVFTAFIDEKKVYFNSGDIQVYLNDFLEGNICTKLSNRDSGDSDQSIRQPLIDSIKSDCDNELNNVLSYGYITAVTSVLNSMTTISNTDISVINTSNVLDIYFNNLRIIQATQILVKDIGWYLKACLQKLTTRLKISLLSTLCVNILFLIFFTYVDYKRYLEKLIKE